MNERLKFIQSAGEGIRTAYEVLGLTVEQIAEQQDLAVGEVKAILYACSPVYKQDIGMSVESEDEFVELYKDLARSCPETAVREKALRFLINEKKGRNDVPVELLKLKRRAQAVEEVDIMTRLKQFGEEIRQARDAINTTPAPLLENK